MSELLEQIKGYLKAFEAINNGNYEGPDYFIEEIIFSGNELIDIENFLMRKSIGHEEPESLRFERVENLQVCLGVIFENYFARNVKLLNDTYRKEFCKMLNAYINDRQVEILGSGIKNCYSSITEYLGEVSGSDLLFVFSEKILIIHFGIND